MLLRLYVPLGMIAAADNFAITGQSSFAVRADRDGSGNGRVYEIRFTVKDPSGNSSAGTCTIRVPHDRQSP